MRRRLPGHWPSLAAGTAFGLALAAGVGLAQPSGPAASAAPATKTPTPLTALLTTVARYGPSFTLAAGEPAIGAVAYCAPGEVPVSGGVVFGNLAAADRTKVHVFESALSDPEGGVPTGRRGWSTKVAFEGGAPAGLQVNFAATCLQQIAA